MATTATLQSLSPTVAAVTQAGMPMMAGAPCPPNVVATYPASSLAGAAWGAGILGFLVIFAVIWIILFSFRPTWVRYVAKGETAPAPDAPADPAKCFVSALIIALIIIFIIWIFSACTRKC